MLENKRWKHSSSLWLHCLKCLICPEEAGTVRVRVGIQEQHAGQVKAPLMIMQAKAGTGKLGNGGQRTGGFTGEQRQRQVKKTGRGRYRQEDKRGCAVGNEQQTGRDASAVCGFRSHADSGPGAGVAEWEYRARAGAVTVTPPVSCSRKEY